MGELATILHVFKVIVTLYPQFLLTLPFILSLYFLLIFSSSESTQVEFRTLRKRRERITVTSVSHPCISCCEENIHLYAFELRYNHGNYVSHAGS